MRVLLVAAVALLATGAYAQNPPPWWRCAGCTVAPLGETTMRVQSGDQDIDTAMAICDRHREPFILSPPGALSGDTVVAGPLVVGSYQSAWKANCEAVEAQWNTTETARRKREAEAAEQRDMEFVAKVAKQHQ